MVAAFRPTPGSKRCPTCEVVKPLSEFSPCKSKADGRSAHCRPCAAEIQRARRVKRNISGAYHAEKRRRRRLYSELAQTEYRDCLDCKKTKRLGLFPFSAGSASRLCLARCRVCHHKRLKEKYWATRDLEKQRAKYRRHREVLNRCDCTKLSGGHLVVIPLAPIAVPKSMCPECFHLNGINRTEHRVISVLQMLGGSATASAIELELAGGDLEGLTAEDAEKKLTAADRRKFAGLKTLAQRGRVVKFQDDPQDEAVYTLVVGRFYAVHDEVETRKLTVERVQEIRALSAQGLSQREIASRLRVSRMTIRDVVTRRTWRKV